MIVLNRCIPNVPIDQLETLLPDLFTNSDTPTATSYQDLRETSVQIMEDVYESWYVILICTGTAFALSFLWVVLSRPFGGVMVWSTLIVGSLMAMAFTAYIW